MLALGTQPSCCKEAQDTWKCHIEMFQPAAAANVLANSKHQLPSIWVDKAWGDSSPSLWAALADGEWGRNDCLTYSQPNYRHVRKIICCYCFKLQNLRVSCGGSKNLPAMQRPRFTPWVRKIPWTKGWLPTPVILPREFHGQKSPAGYNPWGHKESDPTEPLTLSLSVTQWIDD